jgi:hypothetical protein
LHAHRRPHLRNDAAPLAGAGVPVEEVFTGAAAPPGGAVGAISASKAAEALEAVPAAADLEAVEEWEADRSQGREDFFLILPAILAAVLISGAEVLDRGDLLATSRAVQILGAGASGRPLAASRAVPILEAEALGILLPLIISAEAPASAAVSGHPHFLAVPIAPGRGNPWRVARLGTRAGCIPLEIRAAVRRRLTRWGM